MRGKRNTPPRFCVICGTRLHGKQLNCCSVPCQYQHNRGPNHHSYKGGYIDAEGYRRVCVNGKPMLEHRYLMEKHLGRVLDAEEVVHHRDGNRANNVIENLELLPSQCAHMQEHRKSFTSETHRECTRCGQIKPRTEFYPSRRAKPGQDQHHGHCKECQCASKRVAYEKRPRTDSHIVSAFGETKTVAEWSRDPRCPVGQTGLHARLQKGWPAEFAITAAPGSRPVETGMQATLQYASGKLESSRCESRPAPAGE